MLYYARAYSPSNESYGSPETARRYLEAQFYFFLLSVLWLISRSSAAIAERNLPSRKANSNSTQRRALVPQSVARIAETLVAHSATMLRGSCTTPFARSVALPAKFPSNHVQWKRGASLSSVANASGHSGPRKLSFDNVPKRNRLRKGSVFLCSSFINPRSLGFRL